MSNVTGNKKVSGLQGLAEGEGLTLEEFKKKVMETFYTQYGRYENASGKMYCELEHNGADDNHAQGSVKWRKGITGGEVLEDEVLEREQAIPRFFKMVDKGYSLVFSAVTASDFEKRRAEQLATFSAMKREGLLGVYERGAETFRVNEYEGVYSVEKLYNGMITAGKHGLTEQEARAELEQAKADGFHREGESDVEQTFDPFAAWRNSDEVAEAEEPEVEDGMSALLKAFGD